MSTSVQKTAAEEGFASIFDEVAGSLPGVGKIAAMRKEAIATFGEKGLPHRRVEEWRYTDLKMLMKSAFQPASSGQVSKDQIDQELGALAAVDSTRFVFVDGVLNAELSDDMPDSVQAMSMASALADDCFADNFIAASSDSNADSKDAVVALNTALMSDGAALLVSGLVEKPVHLIFVNSGASEHLVTLRNHIAVTDNAQVTLLESHIAVGEASIQSNCLTHLGISAGANVQHTKFQNENANSTHLATIKADLMEGAVYNEHLFNMGGGVVRNQHFIRLAGRLADYNMSAAVLVRDKQHCDNTLLIDHVAPECKSRETIKAVMDDTARAVVQAKAVVRPEAQKTDGKQMMRGLMLSETAEFNAKPELEIYADDVECGHGATSGKIDEDLLFYLKSRGITDKEARGLLIQAFVGEVTEQIEHEGIREAMSGFASNWLAGQSV